MKYHDASGKSSVGPKRPGFSGQSGRNSSEVDMRFLVESGNGRSDSQKLEALHVVDVLAGNVDRPFQSLHVEMYLRERESQTKTERPKEREERRKKKIKKEI